MVRHFAGSVGPFTQLYLNQSVNHIGQMIQASTGTGSNRGAAYDCFGLTWQGPHEHSLTSRGTSDMLNFGADLDASFDELSPSRSFQVKRENGFWSPSRPVQRGITWSSAWHYGIVIVPAS